MRRVYTYRYHFRTCNQKYLIDEITQYIESLNGVINILNYKYILISVCAHIIIHLIVVQIHMPDPVVHTLQLCRPYICRQNNSPLHLFQDY